jgi:AraC-like DNA-binding protein
MKGVPKNLVGKKCFYGSISAFSTAFKKQFGVPPTEWENNWRYDTTVLDTAKM